jgi:broad specificity phosphatase PhoE
MQHRLLLLRHGETEWSRSGRHTGRTDLDLTETGRERARLTAEALAELELVNPLVVSSPRRRAQDTAELAGLTVDEVSPLLAEWDYGDYEGLTTPQIRETVPDWLIWTHGAKGGESVAQVSDRADQAIAYALGHMETRDVLFVGHGHFSRAVITRWAELALAEGIRFAMAAASVAVCGFEHGVRQISALGLTGYPHPCAPT